ncbi:glycoside hydrolase family 35 protein [Enterococcus sp. LJL90]
MGTFEIKEDFLLDGQPFQIISGSIHYFRVVPEYWLDRLEKLRLMGCNTVETYVPWNLHEAQEGVFNFEKGLDLRRFIQTAQQVGLYVILRPAPYICAEWEFGGLPYWLLKDPFMKIRFSYPPYLEKVKNYFERLFLEFIDLQIDQEGPIILMQVENEYGGYGNDKNYLYQQAQLMRELGVTIPLITSDGPWQDNLENGSIPDVALPTINCGSKIKENFQKLATFQGEKRPKMVTEFWIGWFDAWGDETHHQTDRFDANQELADALHEGSVNIYMFHGGTNFGFMNGANYYEKLAPDVTSYDYDAPLSESGEITPKYLAFQKTISQFASLPSFPLSTTIKKINYGEIKLMDSVSLIATLSQISQPISSPYPVSMEMLDQGYGYIYYQSEIGAARTIEDFRLINCNDRAQIMVNNQLLFTQYDKEIGKKVAFDLTEAKNTLGILVENMGRVNYSVKMNHQTKGIRDGVILNGAFQSQWQIYSLTMDNLEKIDFSGDFISGMPSFYRFIFNVTEIGDTFIDCRGWGKGFVTVNGFNIGRFWEIGPQERLYIPGPLLKLGENEIIIFETEGKSSDKIILSDEAKLG